MILVVTLLSLIQLITIWRWQSVYQYIKWSWKTCTTPPRAIRRQWDHIYAPDDIIIICTNNQ